MDYQVRVKPDEAQTETLLPVEATTVLVGNTSEGEEAFRITCRFNANYRLAEGVDPPENDSEDSDYFGQQMFLIARPVLVSILGNMGVNTAILPFSLPRAEQAEDED